MYQGRKFYMQSDQAVSSNAQMIDAEYFIDSEPGPGNGVKFSINPGDNPAVDTISVNIVESPGVMLMGNPVPVVGTLSKKYSAFNIFGSGSIILLP